MPNLTNNTLTSEKVKIITAVVPPTHHLQACSTLATLRSSNVDRTAAGAAWCNTLTHSWVYKAQAAAMAAK